MPLGSGSFRRQSSRRTSFSPRRRAGRQAESPCRGRPRHAARSACRSFRQRRPGSGSGPSARISRFPPAESPIPPAFFLWSGCRSCPGRGYRPSPGSQCCTAPGPAPVSGPAGQFRPPGPRRSAASVPPESCPAWRPRWRAPRRPSAASARASASGTGQAPGAAGPCCPSGSAFSSPASGRIPAGAAAGPPWSDGRHSFPRRRRPSGPSPVPPSGRIRSTASRPPAWECRCSPRSAGFPWPAPRRKPQCSPPQSGPRRGRPPDPPPRFPPASARFPGRPGSHAPGARSAASSSGWCSGPGFPE